MVREWVVETICKFLQMRKVEKLFGDHVERGDVTFNDDGAVFELGTSPGRCTFRTFHRLRSWGSRTTLGPGLLCLPVVLHALGYFG